jgi:hypothetical protein
MRQFGKFRITKEREKPEMKFAAIGLNIASNVLLKGVDDETGQTGAFETGQFQGLLGSPG